MPSCDFHMLTDQSNTCQSSTSTDNALTLSITLNFSYVEPERENYRHCVIALLGRFFYIFYEKIYECYIVLLFYCFSVPWSLNSFDLSSCGSKSMKRYTIRLPLMCLGGGSFEKWSAWGGMSNLGEGLPWGLGGGGKYVFDKQLLQESL